MSNLAGKQSPSSFTLSSIGQLENIHIRPVGKSESCMSRDPSFALHNKIRERLSRHPSSFGEEGLAVPSEDHHLNRIYSRTTS